MKASWSLKRSLLWHLDMFDIFRNSPYTDWVVVRNVRGVYSNRRPLITMFLVWALNLTLLLLFFDFTQLISVLDCVVLRSMHLACSLGFGGYWKGTGHRGVFRIPTVRRMAKEEDVIGSTPLSDLCRQKLCAWYKTLLYGTVLQFFHVR